MPNILDYIAWRGDIPLDKMPLNEVDDLVLAQLAYVSFGPFVPHVRLFPEYITLGAAAQFLLDYDPQGDKIHQPFFFRKDNNKLLAALKDASRFRDVRLCAAAEELNDETQFYALCMGLPSGEHVIAFRGTDDSIAGWKEDLLMALDDPIPAQQKSAEYLEYVASLCQGPFILTGHSKGGNLAVYAAANAPESVQNRILRITDLDGPGFSGQLIHTPGYQAVSDKIRSYIPESSVVGMLLDHGNDAHIIKAKALGILQHDAYSWQVMGDKIVPGEGLTAGSEYTNVVIKNWLSELSGEQKQEFLTALYEAMGAVDAKTVDEGFVYVMKSMPTVLKKLMLLDKTHKEQLLKMLTSLGGTAIKTLLGIKTNTHEKLSDDGAQKIASGGADEAWPQDVFLDIEHETSPQDN